MTNLEYLVTRESIDNCISLCILTYKSKNKRDCLGVDCSDCEFHKNSVLCVQTLLEEHKEPIKLTQVEYDILASYYENQSITNHNQRLNEYAIFPRLKKTGKYFKDLDLFLTIGEVYKNCEVVENVD